ncbi:hypothetical protein Pta02_10960 [Planobispora takensis]|uniref:Uncharacterized protein n=1 Tax=Planobispora takensis TaxID=1367882 RepID=A0A8J3SUJ7_9ACTN|nr:hypothetical protein Pta02_10960 [Planobispora takensis]
MSARRPMRASALRSPAPGRRPENTSGVIPHQAPQEGMSLALTSQPGVEESSPSRPLAGVWCVASRATPEAWVHAPSPSIRTTQEPAIPDIFSADIKSAFVRYNSASHMIHLRVS